MEKKKRQLLIVGDLGVGGERGRVIMNRGGLPTISATEYKDPIKVVKRWKRK